MWIDRKVYEAERLSAAENIGKLQMSQAALAAVQAQMEWMRIRVTQLEKERALLTYKLTGIAIETPVVTEEHKTGETGNFPGFGDVGDEMAKKLGYEWDQTTGAVTYTKPEAQPIL